MATFNIKLIIFLIKNIKLIVLASLTSDTTNTGDSVQFRANYSMRTRSRTYSGFKVYFVIYSHTRLINNSISTGSDSQVISGKSFSPI